MSYLKVKSSIAMLSLVLSLGGQSVMPLTTYAQSCVAGVTMRGDGRANFIEGTDGNDNIDGRDGNDALYGLGCDDTIRGGGNHDNIYGGDGNDVIRGSDGDDFIDGGPGYDICYGENGRDRFANCEVSFQ